jgi:hypothetical protein
LAIKPVETKQLNSERLTRNTVLLPRPKTLGLHQILRRFSSSEFTVDKEDLMASKVLVIVSTAEKQKALTGIMYSVNAQKNTPRVMSRLSFKVVADF